MPPGYAVKSTVVADLQRTAEVMASIPLSHQRMVRAMVATNPVMGFLGRNDTTQTAIVSFRGTETREDWLKDFDSRPSRSPTSPIAFSTSGIQRRLPDHSRQRDCRIRRRESERDLDVDHRPQSRRGYRAPRCAGLRKSAVTPLVSQLYTFAVPRVGDDTFKNIFDATIPLCYRVWNRWVIVPQLPPPPLFIHVGQGIEVDGGFTLDLAKAHSLEDSYRPGLLKL